MKNTIFSTLKKFFLVDALLKPNRRLDIKKWNTISWKESLWNSHLDWNIVMTHFVIGFSRYNLPPNQSTVLCLIRVKEYIYKKSLKIPKGHQRAYIEGHPPEWRKQKKRRNNDHQNTTQKTKNRSTRTHWEPGAPKG